METWSDKRECWPVRRHEQNFKSGPFGFVTDEVESPDGEFLTRSYLTHPGAVAILALDENDCIVVVHQYRHPVGMKMVELPAGLLDVAGEDYLVAAQRELAEETELAANTWHVLVDFCCSPGSTQESLRVFLARGLQHIARPEGFVVEGEERDMAVARVSRPELVAKILRGELQNPSLVAGVLALQASLHDLDSLRPPNAPWIARRAQENGYDGADS